MRKPLLIFAVSLLLAAASGARAGEDLTAMTNADRTANGLSALTTARDLQSFAQRRAEDMARAGKLWHSEDLGTRISNWKRLGENIGRGQSVSAIQRNFMASPSHRENILFPQFSEIGVGVASDGRHYVYVSVVFREPAGTPTPAPAPAPPPAPRPRQATARPRLAAPAPRPKPKPKPAPTTTMTPPTTVPPAPVAAPEPPPPPPVPEPPPAPPVEVLPEQIFRPRPVFQNPDFLAANFFGASLPAPARGADFPFPQPAAGAVIGLVGVFGGVHAGARRWLSRTRGLTPN